MDNTTKLSWRTEKRRISTLIPYDKNPRILTSKQESDLKKSLEKFDLVEIPAINTDGKIIAGHQRIATLIAIGRGDEEIDVRIPSRELSDEEFKEYNLRSNKNTGEWDWSLLSGFGEDMLRDVGFNTDEINKSFLMSASEDGFDADAEYASIDKPVTVRGDLYILGDHRLLCGDSTSVDDFTRLMDGALADMVFTDPPYNVNYSYAKYRAIGRKNKKYKDDAKIFNDNKTAQDFEQFLNNVFRNIYAFSKKEMSIYVCHATKTQSEFFNAFSDSGFHFSQTIIWLKDRMILAMGQDYHRVYEPILFGWKEGESHYKNKLLCKEREVWLMDRNTFEEQIDVWYIAKDKVADYVHPTQKPVRLPERAINKNCPIGGLLVEPFVGSGSTLMACEQMKRRCFGMEMDPKYCDVIVKRWEKFTGSKAEIASREVLTKA